jgi:hypothetical protein
MERPIEPNKLVFAIITKGFSVYAICIVREHARRRYGRWVGGGGGGGIERHGKKTGSDCEEEPRN